MELRDYQTRVIGELRELLANLRPGERLAILQAETGAGKTVMALEPIRLAYLRGKRSLFLARGRELVTQCSRHLDSWNIPHGVIMRGQGYDLGYPVQVASKDTFLSWIFRHRRFELPPADLVIVDEAHESLAAQWFKIISAYRETATIIGLTATPCRTDGRGLGDLYRGMVRAESGPRLIARGYLVPTKVYAPVTIDMKGVRKIGSDFDKKEMSKRLDKPKLVGDVVRHWQDLGQNRQSVVYCPTVAVSLHVTEQFKKAGIPWEHLDGKTDLDERDRIIQEFSRESIRGICNVGVLVQGVDIPNIGCVVWYTATASLRKFRQGNGRGKRPAAGKSDCIIIDHAGNVFCHGLPDDDVPWTLDASKRIEDVQEKLRQEGKAAQPVTCPMCYAMFKPAPECPACGHKFAKRPKASGDATDGKLSLVGSERFRTPTFAEKQSFWRSRLYIAAAKGLKVSAAAGMYKREFDEWPANEFVPAPPRGDGWKTLAREFLDNLKQRKQVVG